MRWFPSLIRMPLLTGHKVQNLAPIVSFVSIATGSYLDFWQNQIRSARVYFDKSENIEFVLLTDQPDKIHQIEKELFSDTNWKLQFGIVPHQEWPFPTLYKFKHIIANSDLLNAEVVWHLDADMLFAEQEVYHELIESSAQGQMVFVSHPGYFRMHRQKRIFLYFNTPLLLLRDLNTYLKEGGIGTWEKSRTSNSFVESRKRINYICGGSWGGERNVVLEFSREVSGRIDADFELNIVARFHDESHINWFKANHECKILEPSYCYEGSYTHLKSLKGKIIAVNKNVDSSWER